MVSPPHEASGALASPSAHAVARAPLLLALQASPAAHLSEADGEACPCRGGCYRTGAAAPAHYGNPSADKKHRGMERPRGLHPRLPFYQPADRRRHERALRPTLSESHRQPFVHGDVGRRPQGRKHPAPPRTLARHREPGHHPGRRPAGAEALGRLVAKDSAALRRRGHPAGNPPTRR